MVQSSKQKSECALNYRVWPDLEVLQQEFHKKLLKMLTLLSI